jgi:SAM-dependent methyltransferase
MNAILQERAAVAETESLECVDCQLCGSASYDVVLRAADSAFCVVQCQQCLLHFTNPRPTRKAIGQFYPPHYPPHSGKAHYQRPLRSWYPLDWLRTQSMKCASPRLLDFGCGAGHFLAAMDRAGWEVAGLDVSQTAVDAIRDELGLPSFAGSLPHEACEPASFDCITMWHSLEHVYQPLQILDEARRLLVPGGKLIVAVPNFASWSRRRFGSDWFGLDLPRHLTHFERDTLTELLEIAGLSVREVRFARHADWIRSSAQQCSGGIGNRLLRNRTVAAWVARFGIRETDGDAVMVLAERG